MCAGVYRYRDWIGSGKGEGRDEERRGTITRAGTEAEIEGHNEGGGRNGAGGEAQRRDAAGIEGAVSAATVHRKESEMRWCTETSDGEGGESRKRMYIQVEVVEDVLTWSCRVLKWTWAGCNLDAVQRICVGYQGGNWTRKEGEALAKVGKLSR
ncbi:hypothetical protein B0H16DRAFT_1707862 [Mycena metata]|uniref:Uncharacterized protein n=1 Tax=Mycena metata TaxID=1033252 RepID=A0AAD7GCP4_9AGAR|nr:hypothetical protein B0H16DRAFT_1707862 [Mycena metata]